MCIRDRYDIPVLCYGLKTDFRGVLFEGSKRLMELADAIEELPIICWCGKKAHFNARVIDGKMVRDGAVSYTHLDVYKRQGKRS